MSSYIFETNQGNYLIANNDLPLICLPFQDEGLQYVDCLNMSVEHLIENPGNSCEVGSGFSAGMSYWTHLSSDQLREAIEKNRREVRSRIHDIEVRHRQLPEHNAYLEHLEKLEASLTPDE